MYADPPQESNSPPRIPTDFCYWQNIQRPESQRIRWALEKLFGLDPVLPDEVIRSWAASYYHADPVAEDFVQEVYLQRGQKRGRELLDAALKQGIDALPDAPASMKRLFAEVEQPPAWMDPAQVDLGARVFRRYGTRMYAFAGAITLQGYLENSVSKPLAFTGAYNGESAQRRFLETARFWIDVSEPDGLKPGGMGLQTSMRVRIMHVYVRKRLLQHPAWQLDAWGVPISQADALLTLMGGSFLPGYLLKLMGYRSSREEILAMMHFWRYVGHLLGVQPAWYPRDIQEALGLMFTSHVKSSQGSLDDGSQLARSYLDSFAPTGRAEGLERLRQWWEFGLHRGYVGFFLPPATHRAYGLPSPGAWRLHPALQAPFIFGFETLRKRSPWLERWHDQRMRAQTRRWVHRHLGERRAEFKAVSQFTR